MKIEDLKKEYNQIKERSLSLSNYILDDAGFPDETPEQKRAIQIQYEAMCVYQDAIERRIKLMEQKKS